MQVKLFLRKDPDGNTRIFGKIIGQFTEHDDTVFEGKLDVVTGSDLLLSGDLREPNKMYDGERRTESCSDRAIGRELGKV
jgi:hypothetical protein